MKTAGLVIDFYDDIGGRTLKQSYPTIDALPEVVKVAHILNAEEREVLRDDAFALVMQNEGKILRKFACVDPGNTLLSMLYFTKTAELLPAVARESAYDHITERALEFYLIDGSEKTAAASGKRRTRDSMRQPVVGDDADWAQRTNLVSVRGGADAGRVIPAANNMKTAAAVDFGALATKGKDALTKGWASAKPHLTKAWATTKPHLTQAKDFVTSNPKATALTAGAGIVAGRTSKSKQGSVVDVTGLEPEQVLVQREAERMALGRYPLDSYADVRAAAQYFDRSWTEMDPSDRHEFAVKTAARCDEIGLDTSELLRRYGSTRYSPDVEAHLASRRINSDDEFHELYDTLQEKRAGIEPEQFAQLLAEVDQLSGLNYSWGGAIVDPWLSTFGGNSEQEKVAFVWDGGDVSVDEEALTNLAGNKDLLLSTFEKPIVDAFMKDPVTIFSSLPDDAKTILANLANG